MGKWIMDGQKNWTGTKLQHADILADLIKMRSKHWTIFRK